MRGGNFENVDIILGFLVAALKSATGLFNCTFQGHSQTKNSFSPVYLAHYNRQRKMGDEKPLLHIVPNESGGHFRFIQPGRPKDWLKVDISEVCTRNAMPLLNNSPGTCLQPAGLGHRLAAWVSERVRRIATTHWPPASENVHPGLAGLGLVTGPGTGPGQPPGVRVTARHN